MSDPYATRDIARRLEQTQVKEVPFSGYAARVTGSAQSIGTGASTALSFNSERYDLRNFFDAGSATRLTCPIGGTFLIGGHAAFASNATGYRFLVIRVNGTTEIAIQMANAINGNITGLSITTEYQLAAGDYVQLLAFQNSGGNLNVSAVGNYSPEFWIALQ